MGVWHAVRSWLRASSPRQDAKREISVEIPGIKELLEPEPTPELAAVAPGGWVGAGEALAAGRFTFGEPGKQPMVHRIFDGEKDDLPEEEDEDDGLEEEDALFQDQTDGEGDDHKDARSGLHGYSPMLPAVDTLPQTTAPAPSARQSQLSGCVEQRTEPQRLLNSLDSFAEAHPQTLAVTPSVDPNQLTESVEETTDPQDLLNSLDLFVTLQRAFTLDEFGEWLGPGFNPETVSRTLVADPRVVVLSTDEASPSFFVASDALFRWYVFITLRLAQAGQTRLRTLQLAQAISSLRLHDRWITAPQAAIVFGENYGFISPAIIVDEYVFPIAQVLARLPRHSLREAKSVLRSMTHPLNRGSALGQPLRFWVQAGLANFDSRVVEVVQSRENLNAGEPQTLEQIGVRLGVTRERVRQLEATFWERLSPHPIKQVTSRNKVRFRRHLLQPFVLGLLVEAMRRRGRLVLDSESSDDRLMTFVARCVGLSPIEIPNTTLAILGTANPDNLAFDQNAPSLDLAEIAKWVNSCFNLPKDDVSLIARHAAEYRLQHSNKVQKVYLALKQIGKPAHFSAIADVYNTLFPDDPSSEHNVHAVLTREHEDVVWIGIKGTYALREWGYERPSMGLYDAVADIVQRIHERSGNPVSGDVIRAEIGKYRKVLNPPSIQMAIDLNPRIRKISADGFVPKNPDEKGESELSAAGLDQILRDFEKTRAELIPEEENA